ncbi:MAG: PaaI family thioesterase [Actinomycetota bacterium]
MTRAARERLAAAIRTLVAHAVEADIESADSERVADSLEQLVEQLDQVPRRGPKMPERPDFEDLQLNFGYDPVVGKANPIAPPVEITYGDDMSVHGRANLDRQYEGPPGYVHGAIVAAIFDLLLGLANAVAGNQGMTGTLTIKYRRPTPLKTDIDIVARVLRTEGRKSFTYGEIRAGDTLCAECEGVFIALTPEMGAELFPRLERA